ncbi:MAG: amidohydrolase family protein [Acidimicrobiales bacterium]
MLNAPSAGPFVDAHVHFWDRAVEGLRWRFLEPDFEHPRLGGLKKLSAPRYAVSELRTDQAGCDVSKVVHVQAAQSDDPVLETAWLQDLGDREGWPTAIVGYCDLSGPDAGDVVARHAGFPRFRGVRDLQAGERLDHPDVVRGFGLVAQTGTTIEVMTSWNHFHLLQLLVDRWPDAPIVLGHSGLPTSRTDEYFEAWSAAMGQLARRAPNMTCKISALASGADPNWSVESIRRWVVGCIEAFGPQRCMFASNWPVDKLFGTYPDLVAAYGRIAEDLSTEDRRELFSGTCERVYRI